MNTLRHKRTHQRHLLVGLLFLHAMNTFMDRICISTASDLIMSDLNISAQMMGYIFAIFAVSYALFQVPAGWFADTYGPKRALLIVVGFWSSFTVAETAVRRVAGSAAMKRTEAKSSASWTTPPRPSNDRNDLGVVTAPPTGPQTLGRSRSTTGLGSQYAENVMCIATSKWLSARSSSAALFALRSQAR